MARPAPKRLNGGEDPKKVAAAKKPPPEHVADFHTNADTDSGGLALHHTLGTAPGQAAPGNHAHDGVDSPLILDGLTITGQKGTAAWYLSVNSLLARLGATDSST